MRSAPILLIASLVASAASAWTPEELWELWPEERFVETAAPCLLHEELLERLDELQTRYPGELVVEEVGRSFEDRSIRMVRIGRGPIKVLLWSQMHGDEPSATPALLDIADFLLGRPDDEAARLILDGITLLMVPMLNPDGAEVYERRNAQGIDINRDALNLATPEGRILERLRRQHEPLLGFNLHDQNRRTAVGGTGKLATNAVLAVAGDPEGTLTPGRLRAKRASSAIITALAPLMPGGMARYDEDFSPRAFGDNLTAWGTPVVLIESGGIPPGRSLTELTRLNFVALLMVLMDLARDDLEAHDPRLYEELPRNRSNSWSDVVVRGGEVLRPGSAEPYRADLAFNRIRPDRLSAGCGLGAPVRSLLVELGDARFLGAGREVEAAGLVAIPPFVVGVKGWRARRWLDGATLDLLARLGVGQVTWAVKRRWLSSASARAGLWVNEGRPPVQVVAAPAALPLLELRGRPRVPRSDSLAEALEVLGALRGLSPLDRAWSISRSPASDLALRRGSPASFLLVTRPEGKFDPSAARLASVWLDGVEVGGEEQR